MGPESGLRKWPRGVEGVPIGRLLAPKKGGRDAFSYFPNSFKSAILGSARLHAGALLGLQGCRSKAHWPPPGWFRPYLMTLITRIRYKPLRLALRLATVQVPENFFEVELK